MSSEDESTVPEAADKPNPSGPPMAERLITFATEEYEVFRATDGRNYGVRTAEPVRAYGHSPAGSPLMGEIKGVFYARAGKWPDSKASALCSDYLTWQATRAPVREVGFRSCWNGERLLIDSGDADWQVIEVTGDDWGYCKRSPVPFRRSSVTARLATPATSGDLDDLWRLVNVTESDRPLVAALLICAWLTGISQPVVWLTGPQGVGKTETARFLLRIVDPVTISERGGSLPSKEEDWKSRVGAYHCVLIDNASNITRSQSDTLCKVATGGEATTRTLYTNDGAHISDLQSPVWITSIGVGALQGDLGSRMVKIELAPLDVNHRMALSDLRAAQTAALPSITRALLDLTVQVLAVLPVIDRTRIEHRLTDFELILRCVDKVLGTNGAERLTEIADGLAGDVLDADPVALALMRGIDHPTTVPAPVLGDHTATDLLHILTSHAKLLGLDGPTWPRTPKILSEHLQRIAPALAGHGVIIEWTRTKAARSIAVTEVGRAS